ncbi:Hypothetical protein FKW44_018048, partial [Caligus rogercresseyi]
MTGKNPDSRDPPEKPPKPKKLTEWTSSETSKQPKINELLAQKKSPPKNAEKYLNHTSTRNTS